MTLGDPLRPEVPPARAPRRRGPPWSLVASIALVAIGAGLCVAGERDAGMLILGAGLGHAGTRAAKSSEPRA